MKKSLKPIFCLIFALILSSSVFVLTASAAGAAFTLRSSVASVPRDGTVVVTIRCSITEADGIAWIDSLVLNYDSSVYEVVDTGINNRIFRALESTDKVTYHYNYGQSPDEEVLQKGSFEIPVTFRTKSTAQVKETKFSLSNYKLYKNVDDSLPIAVTAAADATVNVNEAKSNNSLLNELSIRDYDIAPAFLKGIFDYTVNVPLDTKSVSVQYKTDDSKATAQVIGDKNLPNNTNTVTVIVTAQDGSSSKYTISVRKTEDTDISTPETTNGENEIEETIEEKIERLETENKRLGTQLLIGTIIPSFLFIVLLIYVLVDKFGHKIFKGEEKNDKTDNAINKQPAGETSDNTAEQKDELVENNQNSTSYFDDLNK